MNKNKDAAGCIIIVNDRKNTALVTEFGFKEDTQNITELH